MRYQNIREEELKAKVAADYFWLYDCTRIIGNVDFCVQAHQAAPGLFERESLLWAEAKTGSSNIYHSLTQLVLTIGKARAFDKHLPPPLLAAFDGEKIAFVPYAELSEIFYLNDFNWNVTPSNHETREFGLVLGRVQAVLEREALIFRFGPDDAELNRFIRQNLAESKRGVEKTRIDKNNFMVVFNKWCATVRPTIRVDWDRAKKAGIIDGDFYLADLLSEENNTLREKLFVLLKHDHYELDRHLTEAGLFASSRTDFTDRQVAHTQFWNRYHRPPNQEYWDYLVARRDLLVPQDVRERKGSFFTPQRWVALSQDYLTQALGDDWQDEYTVWDCAAGTGNLLAGLTNKYNVWASTLEQADVDAMHDRVKNGANLLDAHVFQFDFLNDDFSKLPPPLQEIIRDEEKRRKLVIYINPPYAEATTARTVSGTGQNKAGTAIENKTYQRYKGIMGKASNELFTQFLIRIYKEIPGSRIANFSKLKNLQSSNFSVFRDKFRPKLDKIFLVPADTFDNVKGQFPIGFFVWNGQKEERFDEVLADVYNKEGRLIGQKAFYGNLPASLNKWFVRYQSKTPTPIGFLTNYPPDYQNQDKVFIQNQPSARGGPLRLEANNLLPLSVYFAVRHCIEATWLNDRDQFLYPADSWKTDPAFQSDCLVFTLFHGQNRISAIDGPNHWIPFTETQVAAREKFGSDFMSRYLAGKLRPEAMGGNGQPILFAEVGAPVRFSPAAQAVYDAGLRLWGYYHQQPEANPNAALYDIRAHFQGRNAAGRMQASSPDAGYTERLVALRAAHKALAAQLAPKVYEHGFLK